MGPSSGSLSGATEPVPPPVRSREVTDAGLATRLAWLTALRLGFLSLFLAALVFFYFHAQDTDYPVSQQIVTITIGAGFSLGAAYAVVLRGKRRLYELALVQIFADQLTWTVLVYVSGGASSGATSFYGLTCLVGAILIGPRGAAIAAVLGGGLYFMLCGGFALGWLQPPGDQSPAQYATTVGALAYPVALNALGITVVGLLAGYLAERLGRTGGLLLDAKERIAATERLAMLGGIAAGLAHEIRNPLGSISGSIEMLRESPELSDEDRRLCEIVEREAKRLNQLVTDMMDLAKPRSPKPAVVDLAALCRDVVDLASRSERSAEDVRVRFQGPSDARRAYVDSGQMRQVLWNLIRNGVQASAAGSVVIVSVETEGEKLIVCVSDHGAGISESSKARLFDAFYTTRSHGAGMGLAVVKRVVDDHADWGMSIEVRSPPLGGAEFRVTMPVMS